MARKNHIIAFYGKLPVPSLSYNMVTVDPVVSYKAYFKFQEGSPLVCDCLDDPEIQEGSIAYHPVFGTITYRSSWRFSTERFMSDLAAAENNPAIIAHMIHVNSVGGEAFGCHEAFEAVRALKKPCYGVIDSVAASAGYYLVAGADKVFASSIFSEVGCIGTMALMYDDSGMMEKIGIEEHEYYSSYSPLKNKIFNDASKGDGDEFVKRFLNPMAYRFIEDMKAARPGINQAAQEGETFYAADAMAAGLIDGKNTLDETVEIILKKYGRQQAGPDIDINKINFQQI